MKVPPGGLAVIAASPARGGAAKPLNWESSVSPHHANGRGLRESHHDHRRSRNSAVAWSLHLRW